MQTTYPLWLMNLKALTPKLRGSFRKHPEILAVYAFGSMVEGTNFRSQELDLSSDLDLGILFDDSILPRDKRWNRQWQLYSELSNHVKHELDLVVMNDSSLGVVHQILRTGKRIYEKSGRRYRREESRFLIQALDFLPTKQWIENQIIQHVKRDHG